MNDHPRSENVPVFIIGSPWSGASVVTGLLHRAAGLELAELTPPTSESPLGRFEVAGVIEAHRGILTQMDLDWTCPPGDYDPATIDISHLEEQALVHQQLPKPWGVKDPQLMFMLKAWAAAGVDRVRFVGVLRPETDVIQSLIRRNGIGQLEAESIVAAYLHRMNEIASHAGLAIVEFSNDAPSVVEQTRRVASNLGLDWDEAAATGFFEPSLVHNHVRMDDPTDRYLSLIERSDLDRTIPASDIADLEIGSRFPEPLDRFIGPRNVERRNELWRVATFDLAVSPSVVELIPHGAQTGPVSRPGIDLDVVEVEHPLQVGSVMQRPTAIDGVIGSGLLDSLGGADLVTFLKEVHLSTDELAEAIFDIAEPAETVPIVRHEVNAALLHRAELLEASTTAGWDLVFEHRVSPHRVAFKFRKQIATGDDAVKLAETVERVKTLERVLGLEAAQLRQLQTELKHDGFESPVDAVYISSLVKRATSAEHDLARLKNRRSVRFALYVSRPFKSLFRSVRRWR